MPRTRATATTPKPPTVRDNPTAKARRRPRGSAPPAAALAPIAKRTARLTRTDPKTDPAKRELQRLCYHAYVVEGRPYTAIARDLGIEQETASAYVRLEAERRAGERQASIAAEFDRSLATYSECGRRALFRMDQPGARGDELRWVIYARERIDKLLGLEARAKEDVAVPPQPIIAGVTHEGVTALLQLAIAIKPTTT